MVKDTIITPILVDPIPCTRLLTSTLAVDPVNWTQPVQLVPADPNRKQLTLRVFSPTGVITDFVAFADDPGKLQTPPGFSSAYSAGAPLYHLDNVDLPSHTGPVWVINIGASAITRITAIAITS
jgi:hypothetical protein